MQREGLAGRVSYEKEFASRYEIGQDVQTFCSHCDLPPAIVTARIVELGQPSAETKWAVPARTACRICSRREAHLLPPDDRAKRLRAECRKQPEEA